MTEPGDEFESFLKTRTVLPSGMSDDDKLEPPKALDAIVLQKAREAIRARKRLNRTPRWATPVALAATILLCLSIVLNVSMNTNRPAANLRQMTAATADNTTPAPASPASAAGEGERREKAAAGTSSHEAILPEAKILEPRAPRPPVVAEATTPPPNESQRGNGSAADKAELLANRTRAATQATSEAPSAANAAAADKTAQLADRSRTLAQAPADTPSAANAAKDSIASSATRGDAGTAAQAARESPYAAPPAPLTALRAPAPPSPSSTAAPAAPPPALAKRKAAAPAPSHPQDPKTWLQQIAALRAEGKTAQADAEMRRFRATFPDYPAKPSPPAPSDPPK
ncbi:MAG: hypothetical protein JWO04_4124 [Gammaproteobacteria bacterium]|nr:hypothetical protein [Gammaproteobacteria bacterium]